MNQFLSKSKSFINNRSIESKFNIVVGNESADMDSIVCSVLYAHLMQLNQSESVWLPIIHLPDSDALMLRKDVIHLFDLLSIDVDQLIFIREIIDSSNIDQIVLVDHNHSTLPFNCGRITKIIDHHKDEGFHLESERLIDQTGSCCTLVIKQYIESNAIISESIALMAIAAIVLDTFNFNQSMMKFNNDDLIVFNRLIQLMPTSFNVDEFYELLMNQRQSYDSWDNLLIKDYKQSESNGFTFGVSSINILIKVDDNLIESMNQLMSQKSLKYLVLMGLDPSTMRRELMIFSDNIKFLNHLIDQLMNESLDLSLIQHETKFYHFNQNNIHASRKQIIPMLSKILLI